MSITFKEYWTEIEKLNTICLEDCHQGYIDEFCEAIERSLSCHEWVDYYHYNYDVLKYSDNEDYYLENIGGAGDSFKDVLSKSSYWAMYNDILDF